jgi:hypothetical protein
MGMMKLTTWKARQAPTATDDDFEAKLGALRLATGQADRFVSRCACAVHDKPFTVMYERAEVGGPFVITGIHREGIGDAAGGNTAARSRSVPSTDVDQTGWRCPYCANGSHQVLCGRCGVTVCGGRTRRYPDTGDVFSCRPSCGSRGTLEPLKSVNGYDAACAPKAAVSASSSDALPSPSRDTPRLGAPSVGRRLK